MQKCKEEEKCFKTHLETLEINHGTNATYATYTCTQYTQTEESTQLYIVYKLEISISLSASTKNEVLRKILAL